MKMIHAANYFGEEKRTEVERNEKIDEAVLQIIQTIRQKGDAALLDYAAQFDRANLDQLTVSEEEIQTAIEEVEGSFIEAMTVAKKNIQAFHEAQKEKSWLLHEREGVMLGQQVTPLDRVGIYIPGGKAAYPSTVLMNAIPAIIAGVDNIAIATPPQKDGSINRYVLAAANIVGIQTVYKMGGAQAVAAFAYGTETVKQVDKIVGPGNDYVARAKKWVYGDVAIDMIAGPSEICVVADENANAAYVAADLLSQAEHDEAATSICVTTSEAFAEQVKIEVEKQLQTLDRYDIAKQSIEQNGKIIIAQTMNEAFAIVNDIAPEHLQLMIENATDYIQDVKHAGAIFLGDYSPEPLGDYMAGPNHTLPTSGTATFASPLGVYDFQKKSSIIRYSKEAFMKEATFIETIAQTEGLTAHAASISIRKQ